MKDKDLIIVEREKIIVERETRIKELEKEVARLNDMLASGGQASSELQKQLAQAQEDLRAAKE